MIKSLKIEMASIRRLLGIDEAYRVMYAPNFDAAFTKLDEIEETLNLRDYALGNSERYVGQKLVGVRSSVLAFSERYQSESSDRDFENLMGNLSHFMHLVETVED